MKIIYITDIHGKFDEVKKLLLETVADIYIIAGDLIDLPFYNIDTAIRFHELQEYFNGLRRESIMNDIVLEDMVEDMLKDSQTVESLKDSLREYRHLTIRARRVMQQKYKVLENICSFKTAAKIYTIPGNYDMDLKYTALHERDLHLHWHRIKGLILAGYGGAEAWTAGIPERYIVRYKAGLGVNDRHNEMFTFLKAIKPEIIVTHQPAHGVHDWISYKGPSGSPALRTYCDNNKVMLCLTGHIHDDWGVKYIDGTLYLNPSNFGDVMAATGDIYEGGYFHQIEINNNGIEHIMFRKLAGNLIHDIADYYFDGKDWQKKIIDQGRYDSLERRNNYDLKIKKQQHIKEFELFHDIRNFFRVFQTRETEERIDILEKVTKLLEGHFESIAMDIVGSVNVGLSQARSDIDMVLYLECGHDCSPEKGNCSEYNRAKKMISNYLEGKYKFEIIDCVNLSIVRDSILNQDYDCEMTQRFVAHRSMGRPINYRVIAPVEDLLNRNMQFRQEIEGSLHSFFQIFTNTSQHVSSFEKYELRLKSLGIKIPDVMRFKIKDYLQKDTNMSDKE